MQIETHAPTPPLNDLIEFFVYFQDYLPEHSLEKVVPDGSAYLIIELDGMPRFVADNVTLEKKTEVTRAWVSGPHTEYITISALQHSEMLAIKFKPHGAFPFFHHHISNFKNSVVGAEKVLGENVFGLRSELLSSPTFASKAKLCEQWLLSNYDKQFVPKPFIASACIAMQSDPTLEFNSIAKMVSDSGVSRKHFVSLFKQHVGLTPKQLQRVLRFNEILAHIQKDDMLPWTQIALSCGYYDQAHFIKEFKTFCGINPSKFISDHGDSKRLNFFPLD